MDLPIPLWWLEFDDKLRESKAVEESVSKSKVRAGFSSAEWDDAKRRHREKMNGRYSGR